MTQLFTADHSLLLIIDVQGKLAQIMYERDKVYKNLTSFIKAAKILNIPIIYTEQAPEKIGPTVSEIAQHLTNLTPIKKKSFSCCGSTEFLHELTKFNRQQIIVAGIETHVCVYQTVIDLMERKFKVQLVADAVSSRTQENKVIALERIKSAGIPLTSTEMIICELLKTAEHKNFKDIMGLIK